MLIGKRQYQTFLKVKGTYRGKIDGLIGPKSFAAGYEFLGDLFEANGSPYVATYSGWSTTRVTNAVSQAVFKELGIYSDRVDGLNGPNTQYALEQYQNLMRDQEGEDGHNAGGHKWPTYSQMENFYGPVGQNIDRFTLPYPMVLAWDTDETVTRMSLNVKCGPSAIGVLEEARDHYGTRGLIDLRLHLFGGSLNVRKMRGGSRYSTHSWAAAIDIDPEHNQFRWTDDKALLDGREYVKWWELWEAAGWVSLGRERNYDWMHVQAVRL